MTLREFVKICQDELIKWGPDPQTEAESIDRVHEELARLRRVHEECKGRSDDEIRAIVRRVLNRGEMETEMETGEKA